MSNLTVTSQLFSPHSTSEHSAFRQRAIDQPTPIPIANVRHTHNPPVKSFPNRSIPESYEEEDADTDHGTHRVGDLCTSFVWYRHKPDFRIALSIEGGHEATDRGTKHLLN